jgi:hypothetical protein
VASASAAEWHVGGSALTGEAPLASATKAARVKWQIGSGAEIGCSKVELKGAKLLAKTGGQIEHAVFTCNEAPSGCTIKGDQGETPALKLEASLGAKSPEVTLVLKPVTGETFAEFTLEGGEQCGLGVQHLKIKGKATLTLPTGREEAAEQLLSFNVPLSSGELVGIGAAGLEGSASLKLASGKAWSFH